MGHYQLERYRSWGLVDPERVGRYTERDIDRLVEIRKLEGEARQMARRVIRLRVTNWHLFPVPPDRVRAAMIELLAPRTFRAPKRKWNQMVRVGRALRAELEAQLHAAQGDPFQSMVPRMMLSAPKVRPMPADLSYWTGLLRAPISDWDFGQLVAHSAHDDSINQLRSYWPSDDQIPVEERVTLLTVWAIHHQQQLVESAAKRRSGAVAPI